MQRAKKSASSRPASNPGARSVPSTETDCVPTVAMSQAPLIPSSSEGFFSRTTTAVKKAYITTTHEAIPTHQSASGTLR